MMKKSREIMHLKLPEKINMKVLVYNFVFLCSFIFILTITGHSSLREVTDNPDGPFITSQTSGFQDNAAQSTASGNRTNRDFCGSVNTKFQNFGWFKITCNPDRWEVFDYTPKGNPLFYQEFGFDNQDTDVPVNLMFCGVHGDEEVGIYQCFHLVREILFDKPESLKKFKLVIAPIVNPDGFLAGTRHNANGIDPNRNLPTEDWDSTAHKIWAKYNEDPRKYPGKESASEIETKFQIHLINKYKPDKIFSLHAPLGFLDFDGPGDQKYYNLFRVEHRAKYLGLNIEANTKRFLKLVDFPFFPGSLGNYAGNERKIPTYTIELEDNDLSSAYEYWTIMQYAFIRALGFAVYDRDEVNPYFRAQNLVNIAVDEES
jgi:protein MpaA